MLTYINIFAVRRSSTVWVRQVKDDFVASCSTGVLARPGRARWPAGLLPDLGENVGAGAHAIETLLRCEPTLSYNLLRLVNSLGSSSGRRVTSFSQALLILGRQQLRRWLNLMLFAARQGDVRPAMLLARALELLARSVGLDKHTQEQGFMIGLFSLLGVLLLLDMSARQQPLIALDLAGYLTGWNRGAEALFGYTETEALGRHALFLGADEAGMAEAFMQPGGAVREVKRRTKSGEVIRVAMVLSMIHEDGGALAGMLVQLSPLADALSDPDKVRLHGRIIEDSGQGVLITDCDERIVSINGAFTRITGYTAAESIGQTADLRAVSAAGDDQRGAQRARQHHPYVFAVFRHQRAQGRRSAHAAHGQLRQPDRAAEPQPV